MILLLPLSKDLHNFSISSQRKIQLSRCRLAKNHLHRIGFCSPYQAIVELTPWKTSNFNKVTQSTNTKQSNEAMLIERGDNEIDDVGNWLPKQIHKRF